MEIHEIANSTNSGRNSSGNSGHEVGYLSYGPDAANVLFHIVNERHQRGRPMLTPMRIGPFRSSLEVVA